MLPLQIKEYVPAGGKHVMILDRDRHRIAECVRRENAELIVAAMNSSADRQNATSCYLERSSVREILIGRPDETLEITEGILMEIDALPIVTAADIRSPNDRLKGENIP